MSNGSFFDKTATLTDVFTAHPDVGQATLALNQAIMRAPAPFSPAEREAMAAYVSTLNACQYCHGVHSNAASALGMTDDAVALVCERPEAPEDPRMIPVLAYVGKLTMDPSSVRKADLDRILEAGWNADAISFAAFVAGLYAFMNRLVNGHGITGDPAQLARNGQRLADIGYDGLAELLAER